MATEADVPVAISIATGEGLDRSLKTEKLDRTDNQCSPGTLNESKGDLDQHPEIPTEKHSADGDNVQVEYSMEVESKNNSFGISESEQFFDTLSETSQVEQSNEAGMEIVQNELQLQKGTHVGEPVETSTVENEVFEESKEKFAEDIENHDVAIGAGIISEITKTGDAKLDVEELEASTNETTVDQHVQEMSNQQDSIKEDVDVQCLEKEAEISDADLKGAEKADGNAESYHKEASDPLEATTFEEYKASISTDDVTNSSFKKDIELETNVTSNHEEDSQDTLQNYEQKDEVQTLPEVTPENAKTELAFENAEVISCKEEAIAIQNTPIVLEKEEANPVHCPKENDNTTEEVSEAASIEHEVVEHALPEIQTAENQPQELSEEKCRDHQASVEEAHLSTDKDEKNWDEQAIQEKSSSLVEEEASQQISREEEVQATNLKEEEKEADTKCEEPIEVADTTREIGFETIEQKTETNTDLYVPIPEEKAYAEESTNTFVEDNSFLSEVPEVQTKEIIQEDHSTVSGYGLASGEVSQVSALEEAEAENKEHVNNTPEQKGPQTILTDETVVETEDHAQAGNNYNSQTIAKNIETVEDEGNADAGIAHAECLATIVPDQPALHIEDIELQARENIDSKDKLEEQIPAAADEGGKLLIEAQTENNEQITDTDVIASEEMNPETTLTGETTLDSKDVDVQEERDLSSEGNLEKQLPDVEDTGDTCLKDSEEEKEQETLPTIVTREPPVDIEVTDVQAGGSFSPEEKLEELIPTAADEGDTGLKEAKEENKEQVKSTDSDPEEKVTILTDERALDNEEVELQVEENVVSKDNVEEQIPTKADEGDAGLKEPEEDSKEPVSIIDISPEEKGLETFLTDGTKAGECINSKEIGTESFSTEPQKENEEKVAYADISPEEKIVNLQEQLEEQGQVVADEGDTGLNEAKTENKEHIKCKDIAAEENGLPIISKDVTALHSDKIELQSEEYVSSTDNLEKHIPIPSDEAESGLAEAEIEHKEQATITDSTPEVNNLPEILTDQTALESDEIESPAEENVMSTDYLVKEIPTTADEGKNILTDAKTESKEQVTITDITPEETILTDERSLETEETNVQAKESANSNENLAEEISAAPELGDTCLKKEDEEENMEQVESSSHEVKDLTTILTEETSQELEYTEVKAIENFNSEEILEKQIPTAIYEGETNMKEVAENKTQVETTEIATEEKDLPTILVDETPEGIEVIDEQAGVINSKEVLEKQIATTLDEGEMDSKAAEKDIKEQVETIDIVPEQKGAESISSGERVQDLEDVHAHEQENFNSNENLESQFPTTVGEGETDLNEGEVENKEEVKCSEIAAEEKDVTTILRDETALEIQDVEEKPEEAGKGEESVEVLNDIPVDVHNTEQVDEATVEQSHGEAEPKITIEDGKSEDNPERNHMTVQEVLDEPKITSQDFNDDQIIESNVTSSTPKSIAEDTIKSSQHNEKEITELKEEGSTNKENASDHIQEYIPEDATVQIKDEDYNAVKLENKIIEDSQTAEVDETCEAKNIEKSEDILSTLPVKYDEGQRGEGSNSTPTEAFREESINEDTLSVQVAKDDGNNGVVTVTEKSAEVPSNDEEDLPEVMHKYEPEGEITKLPDVTIEETTPRSSSESVEVITCTKEEIQESMNTTSGEVLETITTKALPEIQIVEDTTKTTELQACVKAAELSTEGENEISEEQTTCEVSSSLVAEKSEENSKEEDTVKSSQDGEKEMTELNEEGISKESVKDENASELSLEYKVDALKSEEEIPEVSETEETLDTLPVTLLLQKQVHNNIDEDTVSVQHTKGNDAAVIVTDISSEVPSNDEDSQVLQKYEQEQEQDVLPEEMTQESSNENAEVVTCTNEETQESLDTENDTNESNTSTVEACIEGGEEEEQKTTHEVSSSPIGEVRTEESSKEEEKKEAHEDCNEAIEGTDKEESSKPDVEDGSISLEASEEVNEKEIRGERFDSEVVSDEREQVETTHIAPEEKKIGGTDVYNTELVRESIVEPSPQVQTHEEVAEPISKVEDETDKSYDPPENSDKISDEVLQESQKDDRDEEIKDAGHNDDYNGTVVLPEAGEEVTSIGEEPSEVTQILELGEKHAQVEGSNDEIEVCELEDKVYVAERTEKETKEVEVSNLALEKPNPDAPEGETIERCEVVPESDSKGIDEVAEDEVTVDQTFDEGVSKEPSTLLSEEKEIIASEHEHTKEVEVPTEEDTGDILAARSAEEICLPEEPTELEVSELAPEKLDAGETEEETKKTSEMVTVSDSQSIGAVCEDEIITDETQCDGEKKLEDSEVVQESLDADAPAEETKDSSAVVLKSDSESIDGLVKEVIIADQTLTEGISKEQLQIPSTALLPEEKELKSSEYEHETKSADKTIEEENPKEVEVPADEDKQESVTLMPTETCLHTEEPRDTESAPHKLDAGETEEEIKGTSETVTISDSQTAVVASGDEIIADQTLCEETTETALSKERELETSELGLEKLATVDIEEIKEGPEIVPIIDSGIIEVVSNDEITIDQTLNEGIMKEQIQSPSSTLLPEEKEHETSEPEHETTAQDESTEQDCTEDLEVSANEDTQALLAARPVEEECSQKEKPSKLNVSEMAVEKLDAGETEDANETFGPVSTSDFPSIVAEPKEDIIVDETLSKGVTDIPLEISSYSSLHQEKELKAYELDLEKADAVTPEEVVGSEVIPQSISQSSCEVSKDETVADQLETPSPTLFPDEKEHKASVHEHGTMIDEKNQEDENLKEVKEPTDEASEYVFVARSVEETCLQKEEPSALKVAEANEYEVVKEPFESVSESDSQSINAVSKDDSIADQTVSDVIANMPLDTPLPNENEEVKEDATELALEKLDTDGTEQVKEGSEVTPKSDLQSIDVVVKDEMITDQVLPESITMEQLLVQPSTLLPEEKELKEVDEHKHGTATQDKNPEEEYAKETEVVADEDTIDVYVASSEETTHLQKEESRELKVSELSPECEEEITATFESTDAVSKEETIAEQLVHQHDEQFLSSSTLVPKEEEEATVPKEEPEDCKVLESSLKGEPEEETKEAFEPAPEVSPQSIGELATDEIVDQIPPSSLIYEEKRCENTTTINNAGDESMNVVETPNDESRKDPHSAVGTTIPNKDPRNMSDLEFPSSQYTERDSSDEQKNLEVATSDSRAEDSCQTPIEENITANIEVSNEEIRDEKEVAKYSQLISVGEENVKDSQQENESREKYPEEKNDTFTAPTEYHHEVPKVDETGSLSGDIEKEVKPDVKSFKDHGTDEADGMNCETQVTYPVEKESSVEISQGVGVEEANGTTQDKKQLEKESHATDIPSSKDEALNYVQGPKLEDTKSSNDTLVARESKEEKFCESGTETVDSTSAQISTKERVEVVTHLTEEKEPTVGKELQSDEEEEEHEVEDAKTDEEKEDTEHKRAHQGYDEPVIVEASRDTEVKVTPKKSHNILSGVGKTVKHSISKVKKAIIGKSSHSKTQAEK